MNTGGPAFPNEYTMSTDDRGRVAPANPQYGLSVRDWFAVQALPAVLTAMNQDVLNRRGENYTQGDIAVKSYIIADMMIAERAKG